MEAAPPPNPPAPRPDKLSDLVTIRPATPDDLAYISSAWSRAAYSHLEAAAYLTGHCRKPEWGCFRDLFRLVQQSILRRAECRVAAATADPTQILSFAIVETPAESKPIVYWVQTKRGSDANLLWKHGIARQLLASWDITTKTPAYYAFPTSAYRLIRPAWDYLPFWLLTFKE